MYKIGKYIIDLQGYVGLRMFIVVGDRGMCRINVQKQCAIEFDDTFTCDLSLLPHTCCRC